MQEQFRQGIDRVQETVRNAPRTAAICAIEQAPAGGAVVLGSVGGSELAKGNVATAVVDFALAAGCLIANQRHNSRIQRAMVEAGVRQGMVMSEMMDQMGPPHVVEVFVPGEEQEGERPPLYQSMDGQTTINNPVELLESVGDPYRGSMRVSKLIRDSEKRDLTTEEIEKLRMAEAAMNIMPDFEETLCDKGQSIVGDMRRLTREAEEKYRYENPTVIDMPQADPQA
jgi:hypothetical protein